MSEPALAQSQEWSPYPHEAVRIQLLWRKRILLALILGLVFLLWVLSLGVTTTTEEQLTLYGGDGSSVTINRPDEAATREPTASVTLRPGRTARLNEPLELLEGSTEPQQRGAQLPEEPKGIPFFGLLLLIGPFILAFLIWRYLSNKGSTEVNYGIYKGSMPFETITASHSRLVLTGRRVGQNPFGKEHADYLREAFGEPLVL